MSDSDFYRVVELFRDLKRWREEQEIKDTEEKEPAKLAAVH